ncbi:hypothetical protein, partial [Akkermansia muciniphila]|uniref:hypothetical protein n=1 Tax=Akkermansia muciniphila TaxID=239935 RepID=UPI001F026A12
IRNRKLFMVFFKKLLHIRKRTGIIRIKKEGGFYGPKRKSKNPPARPGSHPGRGQPEDRGEKTHPATV